MEEEEIGILSDSSNVEQVSDILQCFLKNVSICLLIIE